MDLTILAKAVPGPVTIIHYDGNDVVELCTDSRKVREGALFFCIPGLRIDAHDFAGQAVASGATALVVDHRLDMECAQVIVRNVREALSYMAAAFYGNPASVMKLVGVTGTKGKTTVSFLAKAILEAAGHKVGLIGTVGSVIGDTHIPTTLTTPDPIDFQRLLRRMADEGVEYVVMEVSAHAMALDRVDGMHFVVAGYTNLSQDHLDFFGTMDAYLDAKLRIITGGQCDHVIYNVDDERIARAIQDLSVPKTTIGIRLSADVYAKEIEVGERGCSYRLCFAKRYKTPVDMCLGGVFNVYNSMMAAALCDHLGVDGQYIKEGLESVRNVPGRIELLETETPYRVILDYAHSPDALENILETVRQTAKARVIALFGCGGDRDRDKRAVMGEIGGRLADYCILTSDNARSEDPYAILGQIEHGIKQTDCPYTVIENRREAIRVALKMAKAGDVIVLAGKGHETYQEIKGVKYPFDEKAIVQELLSEIASESEGA